MLRTILCGAEYFLGGKHYALTSYTKILAIKINLTHTNHPQISAETFYRCYHRFVTHILKSTGS